MTKQAQARVITVAVLTAAVGIAVVSRSGWRPQKVAASQTPQDAIYAMLDAAREGNAARYLSNYSGQMEASLKQALAESGEAAFSRYLRESNATIKGVAVNEPQPLTEREVKVRVEYVYQDRNEVQQMYLEKSGPSWKITRVDSAERVKTLIPYGTPVQ